MQYKTKLSKTKPFIILAVLHRRV